MSERPSAGPALGARPLGEGRCRFQVWAPRARRVEVNLVGSGRREALASAAGGYHGGVLAGVHPGDLYLLSLDGGPDRPDPASRFQPDGVHAPSAVVDPAFVWSDGAWRGLPLSDYVLYELHVGTFTREGTFDAAVERLDALAALGVTAVELMPLAQFPGSRNWGYDGASPFAVQASYGGPDGLRRLVDACHVRGLAVVIDVVFNHLGPEGSYLSEFGPYFTGRYKTPWGDAVNFDGPDSDEVRRFFVENALHWLEEYHADALRLDAVHAILDHSAFTFLEQLADAVGSWGASARRPAFLIAESDRNDPRVIRARELGGLGLDAQWNDDFHHILHVLLTGERHGYYEDYGGLQQLAGALRQGYAFTGQRSAYRRRRHGAPSRDLPGERFVVFAQNHDQVGNRMRGDRLAALLPPAALRLAAGVVLLAPFLPLLFMGEEYGETAPFPYFTSHSDPELVEAVRRGRREEFAAFAWSGEVPDPQAEGTFDSARLRWDLREAPGHRELLAWHRELLRLRRASPALAGLRPDRLEATVLERHRVLLVRRWGPGEEVALVVRFAGDAAAVELPLPPGRWARLADAGEGRWGGEGEALPAEVDSDGAVSAHLPVWAFAVLRREA